MTSYYSGTNIPQQHVATGVCTPAHVHTYFFGYYNFGIYFYFVPSNNGIDRWEITPSTVVETIILLLP